MALNQPNPNGQATSANSSPVVIASDQSAVPISLANGGDINAGSTTDVAVVSDANGTVSGKLRGLVKVFADVWDSVNHALKVSTLPLQNTIDSITIYETTDAIMNGTTTLTPKTAIANIAASQTDSNIVTAVTSKKIRVVAVVSQAGATATVLTFNSKPAGAGAGAAISPTFQNGINGGEVLPYNPKGWFETVAGQGLTATTGTGSTTGILVQYIEV